MTRRSPQLRVYLALSSGIEPLWRLVLKKRLKSGKQDPERLQEKLGRPTVPRPMGPVLWFHALSVGESLALLPLLELAGKERPDAAFLLTTSTRTSAEVLAKIGLPPRCIHQYAPIDTAQSIGRFLDFWRPEVAVFAELDFWPALLAATKNRNIPMLLINSRMSKRSFDRRQRTGRLYGDVLNMFDHCLVQDPGTEAHFAEFGLPRDRMRVLGTLKSAAQPLPADTALVKDLKTAIGARPIWLAAATETREDRHILAAHAEVLKRSPRTLLILAPRHLSAAEAIETSAKARFDQVKRRSAAAVPDKNTQVYIADTMGEMGLWYRLAPAAFIGHSLPVDGKNLRGKNPFEAAALGSMILHGPDVIDFEETYATLNKSGAARCVSDAHALGQAILKTENPDHRSPFIAAATQVIRDHQAVLTETWAYIARAATP